VSAGEMESRARRVVASGAVTVYFLTTTGAMQCQHPLYPNLINHLWGISLITHLWGISLPTRSHITSHVIPSAPSSCKSLSAPTILPRLGSSHMDAADPRYIPDVVNDTALARSCGGIHWESTVCT